MKEKWKDFVQFVKGVNPKNRVYIVFPTDDLEELRFALEELTKQAFFESLHLDIGAFRYIYHSLFIEIFEILSQFPHLRYLSIYYNTWALNFWHDVPKPPSLVGLFAKSFYNSGTTYFFNRVNWFLRGPVLQNVWIPSFNPISKRQELFDRFHKASQVYRKVMLNKLRRNQQQRLPNELTEMVLTSAFKVKKNIMRSLCHKTAQSTIKFKALIHCGFDNITYRKIEHRTKYHEINAKFSFY